jgi:hypothetical protein
MWRMTYHVILFHSRNEGPMWKMMWQTFYVRPSLCDFISLQRWGSTMWRMTWQALYVRPQEQGGYTQFTPHYVTWLCPPEYINDPACISQCINNGRYCCPDPDDDFTRGYSGRDVAGGY